MLKKLRIKFIALNMATVAVVLTVVFTTICVVNHRQSVAAVDGALNQAIAQAAEASVNDLSNAVGQNTSKIATLWDAVFSEITTNPFQITFADLTGITLTAGIWNSGLQRLEC